MSDTKVRCPNCGSDDFIAQKKGFSLAKAAGGLVLIGPLGLFGGMIGSRKIQITCLNCSCTFEPGTKPTDLEAQAEAAAAAHQVASLGCAAIGGLVIVVVLFGSSINLLINDIKAYLSRETVRPSESETIQRSESAPQKSDQKNATTLTEPNVNKKDLQEPIPPIQGATLKESAVPTEEPEIRPDQFTPLRPSKKLLAEMKAEKKPHQENTADPEKDTDREKVATGKLEMAKIVVKKNKQAGIKRLKEIVEDYTNTSAAQKAAELLKTYAD